jgi:hypothetical protein
LREREGREKEEGFIEDFIEDFIDLRADDEEGFLPKQKK